MHKRENPPSYCYFHSTATQQGNTKRKIYTTNRFNKLSLPKPNFSVRYTFEYIFA